MSNLNKNLRSYFNNHLERKEEESKHSYSSAPYQGYGCYVPRTAEDFRGVINFYEWSDYNRTPKTFYSYKLFEKFLTDSDIFIVGWQRELILYMHRVYVSCVKGTKDLVIKPTHEALKREMDKSALLTNQGHHTHNMALVYGYGNERSDLPFDYD